MPLAHLQSIAKCHSGVDILSAYMGKNSMGLAQVGVELLNAHTVVCRWSFKESKQILLRYGFSDALGFISEGSSYHRRFLKHSNSPVVYTYIKFYEPVCNLHQFLRPDSCIFCLS